MQCCGILAEALGANWKATAKDLVQPMAQTGLSSELGCTMMKVIARGNRYFLLRVCCGLLVLYSGILV